MISKLSQIINSVLPRLQGAYTTLLVSGASVICTSAIATALVMGARQAGYLQTQELWAYDQFIQWRRDEGPDPRLLVVAITEEDIQQQKKWPLSDRIFAQLLEKLEQQQPRAIGLDIYRDLQVAPGTKELTKQFQQSDRIITVCKVSDTSGNSGIAPPPSVPESRVGFADLLIDSGGILRRSLLFLNPPDINLPTGQKPHLCQNPTADLYAFSLQLALKYLQAEKIEPKLTPSQELQLGSTVFKRITSHAGGYQNVNPGGYQILLNYRSRGPVAQQVTLTQVLTNQVNPNLIKNRVVLIGSTAESIKDYFFTPYSTGQQKNQDMSGVIIHAQAVSQILSAVLDGRPLFSYWPNWAEILWIGGWSIVGGILAWLVRHPLRFSLAAGGAIGSLVVISFGFFCAGVWIPLIPSALTFIATTGSIVIGDRFNKAGYPKAIYEHLKTSFNINFEIDQSKRERQVAKITQSEYFQDLQKKGREIRSKKNQVSPKNNSQTSTDVEETNKNCESSESPDTGYLQQLRNQGEKLKKHRKKTDE